MATVRQIEANRLNARQSTGPRTAEGKTRSAWNALKFGIDAKAEVTPAESAQLLADLAASYMDRFEPATPEQLVHVKVLIRCDWEDTRLSVAEAKLLEHLMLTAPGIEEETALGQAFDLKGRTLAHLGRRLSAVRREYRAALHELERLQALSVRPDPPVEAPQPTEIEAPTTKLGSFCKSPGLGAMTAAGFNPMNPDHPSIEQCPSCNLRGSIQTGCPYRIPS